VLVAHTGIVQSRKMLGNNINFASNFSPQSFIERTILVKLGSLIKPISISTTRIVATFISPKNKVLRKKGTRLLVKDKNPVTRHLRPSKYSTALIVQTLVLVSNLSAVLGQKITASAVISDVHKRVPTGSALHLFPRYGYLSLSMRVVPRNDSQGWVFLEPVKDVFESSTIRIEEKSFNSADKSLPLHNEFHIDLCDDIGQLVQAYFGRFKIQGLNKPWQAFAGGWRTPSLSKYFGLDPVLVVGDYRYMLVRVLMVRNSGSAQLLPNVTVSSEYSSNVKGFDFADDRSIYRFSTEIGTHYVRL